MINEFAPASKEFHQATAMLHARKIRELYSAERKQESRRAVLRHLRLSLTQPVAAELSNVKNER